jgi:hypothetical protein
LSFIERKPTSEDARHEQIMSRLEALAREIGEMKKVSHEGK